MRTLVVTATLGSRPSLGRTIESVRNIGGDCVRHIIVAPEARIPEIKSRYGKDLECIAEPADKKGVYPALNLAFNEYGRKYDYLTYINDDDYWLPKFAELIAVATNNPELDLVYGKTLYVNESNQVIKRQACSRQFHRFNELFHEGVILLTQQTTLVRSDLFFKIGGFDESYRLVADTKFWIQASLLRPRCKFLRKYVSCYTLQPGQLSKDGHTQAMEHGRLRSEFPTGNSLARKLALLQYRLCNIGVYAMRIAGK